MLVTIATVAAAGLLVGALLDAATSDLRAFHIANRDSLLIVAAFVAAVPALGLGVEAALWHAAAGALVFAIGAGLFALGIWGGGDVKLTAAVALMTGFADLPRFLMIMAIVGGMLAGLILLAGRLPLAKAGPVKLWGQRLASSGHVPYGVAIAAGGLDWAATALLPRLV